MSAQQQRGRCEDPACALGRSCRWGADDVSKSEVNHHQVGVRRVVRRVIIAAMSEQPARCPKCQGEMEVGFVQDRIDKLYEVGSQWAAGTPAKSFFGVLKRPARSPIPIGTFRCVVCGFLESYARSDFAPR